MLATCRADTSTFHFHQDHSPRPDSALTTTFFTGSTHSEPPILPLTMSASIMNRVTIDLTGESDAADLDSDDADVVFLSATNPVNPQPNPNHYPPLRLPRPQQAQLPVGHRPIISSAENPIIVDSDSDDPETEDELAREPPRRRRRPSPRPQPEGQSTTMTRISAKGLINFFIASLSNILASSTLCACSRPPFACTCRCW